MSHQEQHAHFLINRRYADYRHGTGVQLKLFADQLIHKPRHVCWDDDRVVADTYRPVCNLNSSVLRVWPFKRGRGLVERMETYLGLTWRAQARIARRLKPLCPGSGATSRAYVVVASEGEAEIARQILAVLGAEYVVNVMDYLHLGTSALSEFPQFAALLKRAKKIFALTPPIQGVLSKISGRTDISLLSVAREPSRKPSRAFVPGTKPFQIVMMGSVDYKRGLQELRHFCRGLDDLGINYCLNYMGPREMRDKLGTQLPVNYCGVRLGSERDEMLNSMHLAYLPGPDGDPAQDYLACYSFPSRLTDYFWHGLPVIGPLFENTATAQILEGLLGKAVWFSRDFKQLVGVARNFVEMPHAWALASESVYNFAQRHFSIDKAAKTILESFAG